MSAAVLETTIHVAALGVRLRDKATGRVVAEDVDVRVLALPALLPLRVVRSPSGTYGAHWRGPEDAAVAVRVEVRDRAGRFHAFAVDDVAVPAADTEELPLYSRPTRFVPAATAVVRARLVREVDRRPATHAALEVTPAPSLAPVRGVADERGEVVVLFPYPEPAGVLGSPPSGTRRPLSNCVWPVAVRVLLPADSSPPEERALPSLDTFLDQSPATLLKSGSPPTELDEAELHYGRELVLRSGPADPELLVRH